jgi:hypothetical protein
MVGIEYTCLIAGYMLSCWVDYGFNFLLPGKMSWQGPFIIQIILAFILFTMSFFLPETPRWLAKNGFMTEALQTLADLHSKGDTQAEHVQQVFVEIQEAVIYETNIGKSTWGVSCATSKLSRPLWLTHTLRTCLPGIGSARLSVLRFKCLPSSTASTSSLFISQVLSHLLDSTTASRFSILAQTPSPIQPRLSLRGI